MAKIDEPSIIVALDFDNAAECLAIAQQLSPKLCRLKVGSELFTACGPSIISTLIEKGFEIFLDLKFHDIPNTVAKSIKAAADLGVWMVNVHASGGERMLVAAREALESHPGTKPLLIAVSVLTSMDDNDLKQVGLQTTPIEQVLHLAQLTHRAGLDGVVCSAQEAPMLRQHIGEDFCLVTPGIRATTSVQDDQRRIVTPRDALAAGSNYLVIGRPITQARNPASACETLIKELY